MNTYTDLFVTFFKSLFGQGFTYFTINGILFLMIWILGQKRFQHRKIQPERRADARQIKTEIKNSLITLTIGTFSTTLLLFFHDQTKLSSDLNDFSWSYLVASFLFLIVWNDTWFYWCHRLMHRPWLFRHIHSVHHKSVDTTPFSSYSFHAVEAVILTLWVIPYVFIVPTYLPVLMAFQLFGLAKNLEAHLGYEFLPQRFHRIGIFKWMSTSTYHNMHHKQYKGNYSLYFRWWDKYCGTELGGYQEKLESRNQTS
jgi:Delta7-sterol 5-desaturase